MAPFCIYARFIVLYAGLPLDIPEKFAGDLLGLCNVPYVAMAKVYAVL